MIPWRVTGSLQIQTTKGVAVERISLFIHIPGTVAFFAGRDRLARIYKIKSHAPACNANGFVRFCFLSVIHQGENYCHKQQDAKENPHA